MSWPLPWSTKYGPIVNVFTKDIKGKALKACCTDTCKLVAFVCAGPMTVHKLRDFHITVDIFSTVFIFQSFHSEELGEKLRLRSGTLGSNGGFLKTKAERLMISIRWLRAT